MKFYKRKFALSTQYIIVDKIVEGDCVFIRGISVKNSQEQVLTPIEGELDWNYFLANYDTCEFNPLLLQVMTPFDVARYRKDL